VSRRGDFFSKPLILLKSIKLFLFIAVLSAAPAVQALQLVRSAACESGLADPVQVSELSQANPGSALALNENVRRPMYELLSKLRGRVTEVNDRLSAQMTAEEVFEVGLGLREDVTTGLQKFIRDCVVQCEDLKREMTSMLTRVSALTKGILDRRVEEIRRIQDGLNGDVFTQVLRNSTSDLLGQFAEIYAFGMLKNPKRGVQMRSYLATLFSTNPKAVAGIFNANGLEERLISKEIDLMVDDDSVWIEVKALDTESQHSFLWEKVKKQMLDHLFLMKRLSAGIEERPPGRSRGVVTAPARKLRYFFLGRLDQAHTEELVADVHRILEKHQKLYGGPALTVEFTMIPLLKP
jgi:hypothetical protein